MTTKLASSEQLERSEDQKIRSTLRGFMAAHGHELNYQTRLHSLLAQVPQTDVGNALRMWARYGLNLRYVEEWGAWFVWNGRSHWRRDDTNFIISLTQEMAGYIAEEAHAVDPQPLTEKQIRQLSPAELEAYERAREKAQALFKWGRQSQSNRSIESAIKQLRGVLGVTVTSDSFDQADMLLNCRNGSLDLATLELLPHDRLDLITKCTGVDYSPAAGCPSWLRFIDKVCEGDPQLARYLQQLTGLGLTGARLTSILPINYGNGGNGKTVYVEMLKEVLGGYAATAGTDLFLDKPAGGINNDVARLVGVRFLAASETKEGMPLNESLVKALTGGDKILARFLYKEHFEFTPKFTPMLLTNHKPVIRNNDNGIWRRLKLVPWRHDFSKDPDVKPMEMVLAELRQEATGILRWAVEGLADFFAYGLAEPDIVKEQTSQYRTESDLVGLFIDDCLVLEPGTRVTKSEVYTKFKEYMINTGHNVMAENKLTLKFREKNIEEKRGSGGVRYWLNVRLRIEADIINEPEPEPETEGF